MLQYNDTTNKQGIIQRLEDILFNGEYGHISGNTTRLQRFTAKVNAKQNDAWALIFQSSTRWQWDDTNQSDFPIITTNIVSGQRDYTFTTDETGNLILDIHRVAIKRSASATIFDEIFPADAQTDPYSDFVEDNTSATGTPWQYDKTANGIFLDPIPNYNATNGLKVYINREGYYFTTSDTTKKPGFAGTLHEYLPVAVAYEYARDNNLRNTTTLARDVLLWEEKIKEYYSKRERDEVHVMKPQFQEYE